jgi:hypothetical protein
MEKEEGKNKDKYLREILEYEWDSRTINSQINNFHTKKETYFDVR